MRREQSIQDIIKMITEDAHYEHYMRQTATDNGWVQDAYDPADLGDWIYVGHPSMLACWVDCALLYLRRLIAGVVCRYKEHDFEDTGSWAGPDSGGEDMTCRRCGFHFRHSYY